MALIRNILLSVCLINMHTETDIQTKTDRQRKTNRPINRQSKTNRPINIQTEKRKLGGND